MGKDGRQCACGRGGRRSEVIKAPNERTVKERKKSQGQACTRDSGASSPGRMQGSLHLSGHLQQQRLRPHPEISARQVRACARGLCQDLARGPDRASIQMRLEFPVQANSRAGSRGAC